MACQLCVARLRVKLRRAEFANLGFAASFMPIVYGTFHRVIQNSKIRTLTPSKISVDQQPLYQKRLLKQSRKTNLTDFDLRCMLLSNKYEKEK
jgi:hypothetical protein